jgi:hypothetical protein
MENRSHPMTRFCDVPYGGRKRNSGKRLVRNSQMVDDQFRRNVGLGSTFQAAISAE